MLERFGGAASTTPRMLFEKLRAVAATNDPVLLREAAEVLADLAFISDADPRAPTRRGTAPHPPAPLDADPRVRGAGEDRRVQERVAFGLRRRLR